VYFLCLEMEEVTILTIDVGLIIAIGGLVISFFTYQYNKQKEEKTDTQQDAQIKARLDYISKGVDDIRIDQKASEKLLSAHSERITRLEESTKQAHKRIDNLDNEFSK